MIGSSSEANVAVDFAHSDLTNVSTDFRRWLAEMSAGGETLNEGTNRECYC